MAETTTLTVGPRSSTAGFAVGDILTVSVLARYRWWQFAGLRRWLGLWPLPRMRQTLHTITAVTSAREMEVSHAE